jgi:hypothetical protein
MVNPRRLDENAGVSNQQGDTIERRDRVGLRVLTSLILGGLIADLAWRSIPQRLSIKTPIIGNPIFVNYNFQRYQSAYYLIALLFPLLSWASYVFITSTGVLGGRTRDRLGWWPIRTDLSIAAKDAAFATSPLAFGSSADWDTEARNLGRLSDEAGTAFRLMVPAGLVGLGVSCSLNEAHVSSVTYLIGFGYIACVVVVAGVASFARPRGAHSQLSRAKPRAWRENLHKVNSWMSLIAVPMLYFMSQATGVRIQSTDHLDHHPWLPLGAAVVLTLAAVGARVWWERSLPLDPEKGKALETRVLTWIVGPIWIFLIIGVLPGALGGFGAFDDAQFLAGPQMVLHQGLFPWRDIYLLHGLIEDFASGVIGLSVFGNTRWGGNAGLYMFVGPLQWIMLYFFAAFFARRNRWILILLVLVASTGLLVLSADRFTFLPIYLLVLYRVIIKPSWGSCALFTGVMFVGAILTPEMALFVVCSYVVMAVFELTTHRPGSRYHDTFCRTVRCLALGATLSAFWFLFLALIGAISGFLNYYLDFSSNHALWGAYPVSWVLHVQTRVTFEFWAPIALWLIAVAWALAKLRRQRVWAPRDWILLAAASYTVVYVPKVLARTDPDHVFEVFTVAMPLLILLVIDAASWLDGLVRVSLHRLRFFALPFNICCLGVVALVVAGATPTTAASVLKYAPGRLRGVSPVPAPTQVPRLGYVVPGAVDTDQIEGLALLLRRYAGPTASVLDYANEPGIVNYLLDRSPGTRFFPIAVTQTLRAQHGAISDLERSRPPVVIFTSTSFGLTSYDGIPQSVRTYLVSQYVFHNYRPLVDFDGQLLLLRDDLFATAPPLPALTGTVTTSNLNFVTQACRFGDIPNFLSLPSGFASAPRLQARVTPVSEIAEGWALPASGSSKAMVLATRGSQIVAAAMTSSERPDVAKALGDPNALFSGFDISIPPGLGPVTLWAVGAGGIVSPLQVGSSAEPEMSYPRQPKGQITLGGRTYQVRTNPAAGEVDIVQRLSAGTFHVAFPPGANLSNYFWLTIHAKGSLGKSSFVIKDSLLSPSTHALTFSTLPGSPASESIMAGSCIQWYGYDAASGLDVQVGGAASTMSDLGISLVG